MSDTVASPTPSPLYEKILASARSPANGPAPRASTSVIPWRRRAGQVEAWWVRRAPTMQFMGGWHAFPGGGLSRRDAGVEVGGAPREVSPDQVTPGLPDLEAPGSPQGDFAPDLVPGLMACALRELFEETGLLVSAGEDPDPTRLRETRRRLLAKEATFGELATEEGWRLDASPLVFAGRWLTPPLAPMRFDNRFFLLEWPAERAVQPELMGGEHVHGEWIAPVEALAQWESGAAIAAPPIVHILRVLSEDGPQDGLARLHDPSEANLGPMRRVEFRPGVILIPTRTATLPPATHTNAYLLGRDDVVLVDPAPSSSSEIERLRQAVTAAGEQGRRLREIWLTHHHPDHVGAVDAMRDAFGVPVKAHRLTAERLARNIAVDDFLEDGERIELNGFPVRVLHTPGHARGHLAFYDETYGSLLIGDLMAGIGTIVIDPPEGDMDDYLASLERVIELAPQAIFPAHGPAILQAVEKVKELRDHRLWREERVVESYEAGLTTAAAMVGKVYHDVSEKVHPIATRQIEAHLIRLRRMGRL